MRILNHIFTDGSFKSTKRCWTSSVVVFRVGEILPFKIYILKGTAGMESRNVTSEFLAGMQAVKIAQEFGASLIHHDYEYVNPSKRMWERFRSPSTRCKMNETSAKYLAFLEANDYRKYVTYKHVKGHSNIIGNELADIACSVAYKLPIVNQWIELSDIAIKNICDLYNNVRR